MCGLGSGLRAGQTSGGQELAGAFGAGLRVTGDRDWFVGVRDVALRFGQAIDWQGLQRLKAQVVVGSEDTANDIQIAAGDALYADGVNETGSNRVERASFLNDLLRKAGVDSRLDVVQGAAHCAAHVQLAVESFFRAL